MRPMTDSEMMQEFTRWIEENRPNVFYRHYDFGEWKKDAFSSWRRNYITVIDDKHADIKKKWYEQDRPLIEYKHADDTEWKTTNHPCWDKDLEFRFIREELCFKDFLIENGIDWLLFLENCQTQNQRWTIPSNYYEGIQRLKNTDHKEWLVKSFNWEHSLQELGYSAWCSLDTKWRKEVTKAEEQGITIIWGE
jgi:hypothetical protein